MMDQTNGRDETNGMDKSNGGPANSPDTAPHARESGQRRSLGATLKQRLSQPLSADEFESVRAYIIGLYPRLAQSRRKISTQLYLAFAVIVALTLLATLVGWYSFDRVATAQRYVNDESVPELVTAFEVAQYSNRLVTAAPEIVTAQTIIDLDEIYADMAMASNSLEATLETLKVHVAETDPGSSHLTFDGMQAGAQTLTDNIKTLRNQRSQLIVQSEYQAVLRRDLASVRGDLEGALIQALDDQLFYVVTGYRDLDQEADPPSAHLSPRELRNYRLLNELLVDANIATELLGNAFSVTEPASLEPLKERFEAAMNRIAFNLNLLEGTQIHEETAPAFQRLGEIGVGEGTGFNLFYEELQLSQSQQELLDSNQVAAVNLVGNVDNLVESARLRAQDATEASLQAILAGRSLLLIISFTSVIVAGLVAWLLVGRILLRRIGMVSAWMRRMAAGNLEIEVDVGGRDEVSDMAAAVEVFRRHALEVQRLNLVELLANDLQVKNDELQAAFEDLRHAQDQIITQQKLASLGELTAGVAHEIRNPLNFVKNFSESSVDLLAELQEALENMESNLEENERVLIQEISDDLKDNMERISTHGDRANRIVHDMLMMSRGSGEFQMTDINRLVDEHSRLAFHSARATDIDFQLDLQYDLDPETGELEVISQDLGRVFLNMVSNSCYATNEKRKKLADNGQNYFPSLKLSTRRLTDSIEISIRDNGSGMPPEVIDKIFNPFFTTKPTDQGTGLGLAISNDIIREHGGSISVTSEPGEFTEMVIELPLTRPAVSVDGEYEGD